MASEVETLIQEPSESEKRIKQLSEKARQEIEAREASDKARAEADTKAADAEKRAAFAEGFTDIVATNPAAKEFKADIQAKVMSGYSVEDATYAVLGKAGKLGQSQGASEPSPAGGSAVITPSQGGTKSIQEMTLAEKRAALLEAEKRGDIGWQ